MTRVCVTGGPRTGKTTLALSLVKPAPIVEHIMRGQGARA